MTLTFSKSTIFGFNNQIDNNETGVSNGLASGEKIVLPASAQTVSIASSSVNDINTTGTGARQCRVTYIDSNGDEIIEIKNMNGQTPVALNNSCFGVDYVEVITAGSTLYNVGTIYCGYGTFTTGKPANILEIIGINTGYSQSASFTIPNNETLEYFNLQINSSLNGSDTAILYLNAYQGLSPTLLKKTPIAISAGSVINLDISAFPRLKAGNHVIFTAIRTSGAGNISIGVLMKIGLEKV